MNPTIIWQPLVLSSGTRAGGADGDTSQMVQSPRSRKKALASGEMLRFPVFNTVRRPKSHVFR